MNLSPQERDKLLIYLAAQVAKERKQRGLKLNVPEATALITAQLLEMARDGKSVAEIMSAGREILGRGDVMEGVSEMVSMIQVEPTFPDVPRLVRSLNDSKNGSPFPRSPSNRLRRCPSTPHWACWPSSARRPTPPRASACMTTRSR